MNLFADSQFRLLFLSLLATLTFASICVLAMRHLPGTRNKHDLLTNLSQRTRSWWVMVLIFFGASFLGKVGSISLFAFTSFLALRELITLTPTHRHDHKALCWSFFIILPLHYVFLGLDRYGIWTIFIPVYAFLFLPVRNVLAGSSEQFLIRTSRLQWALAICVYALSHAPALLCLSDRITGVKLLFFLVIVCQANDVFQFIWGKSLGRRPIAPKISPNKTITGTVGGILTSTALGALLSVVTPFLWWQAALFALVIAISGFFGDLTLSAIKREHQAKDYSTMIPGHGGILDRVDSLAFASPIFFHLTRFFFFSPG